MRAEVEHHLLLTTSEDHGVGQSAATGGDFDRASTSVIETTPRKKPAIDIPRPVCDRAVYDGGPEPDEDHHGNQATALGDGTDNDSRRDTAKLHLLRWLAKASTNMRFEHT